MRATRSFGIWTKQGVVSGTPQSEGIDMLLLKSLLNTVQCGDSEFLLQQIPNSVVDLVITSPPYFQQRAYGYSETGQEWSVENYVDALLDVFWQCVRITKSRGSIVFNIGDKYINGNLMLVPYRFAIAATQSGKVKLVNDITWVKTNPTPRQFKRRLVNSTEPFFHFVKTNDYYYDINEFQNDEQKKIKKTPSTSTIGNRYATLITESKLTAREKRNAKSDLHKVVTEVKAGKIAGFRMKIRGIHSPAFGGQSGGRQLQIDNKGYTIIRLTGKSMKRDVLINKVESLKWNDHPAIYPEKIIENIVKMLTPKKALIVDPYMGSGTTGVVAKRTSRRYIGIDINPRYCKAAIERINEA